MPKPAAAARRRYAPRLSLEDRREQLLDAALRVITRDGYSKISIEAVAREAGVTRPVVYGAYEGLNPLLLALLDRHEARAAERLATFIPTDLRGEAPLETALSGVRAWLADVVADPQFWAPVLTRQHEQPDVVRERFQQTRELVRQILAGTLRAGYPAGAGGFDADVNSHVLLVVLEHFGELLLTEQPPFSVDQSVRAVREILAGWLAVARD